MIGWRDNRGVWLTTLAVLLVDQLSKLWVVSRIPPESSIEIIPGFFNLTFVTNRGIAFGLMPGRTWLFITASFAAVVLLLLFFTTLDRDERLRRIACAFILGGALGNLADRVRLHYVVDFIDLYWQQYHWPAFNVADIAVCLGIGMFLISIAFEVREERLSGAGPDIEPAHGEEQE